MHQLRSLSAQQLLHLPQGDGLWMGQAQPPPNTHKAPGKVRPQLAPGEGPVSGGGELVGPLLEPLGLILSISPYVSHLNPLRV